MRTRQLQLALKAEYFDAIRAGTKTEEYRMYNDYWCRRLLSLTWDGETEARDFNEIVLTKGYPKRGDPERTMRLPWRGWMLKTITHPHFGPGPVKVFAIRVSEESSHV